MKKLILLAFVLVLTACSVGTKSELESNQQKWQSANIGHYRFELNVGCFCAFRDKMPLSVEVKNRQVVAMTYADGTPVSESDRPIFQPYESLDAMFSYVSQQMTNADEVTVTYDADYGFPAEVKIDAIKAAVDDELYLSVSGFESLP